MSERLGRNPLDKKRDRPVVAGATPVSPELPRKLASELASELEGEIIHLPEEEPLLPNLMRPRELAGKIVGGVLKVLLG